MASRGKTTQKTHMFTADFETCDLNEDINDNRQKVWLAGYKSLETMESKIFYNLDDFMNSILARGDNVNTEYAFHNIKFDGSYIVPYLFKAGYTISIGKPESKQFSVLVDYRNSWYSITIQVTTKRKVTLWDTAKLFPMPLEYLPNVYMTPTHKVIEDSAFYEAFRPDGYIPNERELAYFENDLQVPAEALNKHIELLGLQFKKTQASQAFYNLTQHFPAWKWRFPPLTPEIDEACRKAYWGGISHVPKYKATLDHYNLGVFDINSSYPDKTAHKPLPYGEPLFTYGEGAHPNMSKFWIAEALVEFKLKPDCLPCIPSKAIIEGKPLDMDLDKWVDDSEGIVRIRFCSIDYDTMRMSYDIKVWRWVWSIHFAQKVHKELTSFINTNNDIKVSNKALANATKDPDKKAEHLTKSNRAKIDNNASYGKFGEDIIKEGKTPYFISEVEGVEWKTDRKELQKENSRKFLPVAIAITAWGRQQLVIMANLLGKYFLYCDTDSIHYLLKGQYIIDKAIKDGILIVDDVKLGAWKYEGTMKRGRYLRAKCYLEQTIDDKLECTLAGLPADPHTGQFSKQRSYINFDNFHIGLYIPPEHTHKLRSIRTATGTKLEPIHFNINEKTITF